MLSILLIFACLLKAYYLLAKYADSQYEGIKEYIKSSAFEDKQSVRNKVKVNVWIDAKSSQQDHFMELLYF